MNKVLLFEKNAVQYRKIAEEFAEKEDFSRALEFLLSAKSISSNLDVVMDLADLYADMGLLELSNKYWFIYMDKAPKDKVSVAYEELAINYFYLDNFWASSYYFHQKLTVDGYINKQGLSQEILDFFSGEEMKKASYKVVYPFERADFSFEKKRAKRALSVGAFEDAIKIIESIPNACVDEETAGDLAVCYFMSDNLDKAEETCRNSLLTHGENLTAYCNLSTVYDMREDFDNSNFYYQKALEQRKGAHGEAYKIATCAIEREDHLTAKECLENILEERPYEHVMRFFYGLSLANQNKFDRAEEELLKAYRLNPEDVAVKFHLDYVTALKNGKGDEQNLLPFKYVKELPAKISRSWTKKIKDLVKTPDKIQSALKTEGVKAIIEWGLFSNDSTLMRDCVYILSTVYNAYCKNLILQTMLNPDGGEELKRLLLYALIIKGEKSKFGVVAGSFYLKFKPKKLVCEKFADGWLYLSSYALCVSRVIFHDVENLDNIAKACDKVYVALKDKITESEVTNEELGALILSQSKLKRFANDGAVMQLFTVQKEKLTQLKSLVKGE